MGAPSGRADGGEAVLSEELGTAQHGRLSSGTSITGLYDDRIFNISASRCAFGAVRVSPVSCSALSAPVSYACLSSAQVLDDKPSH